MDIICARSGRHFSSYESLKDCKESCSSGNCPYEKNEPISNKSISPIPKYRYPNEPINNPTSDEIKRLEAMFKPKESQKMPNNTQSEPEKPKKETGTFLENNKPIKCPFCGKTSLMWIRYKNAYECSNKRCEVILAKDQSTVFYESKITIISKEEDDDSDDFH